MKWAILLATFMLVLHQTKGQTTASVTCNPDHTVSITISDVDDAKFWNSAEWSTDPGNAACEPTIDGVTDTVTYTNLPLPDCTFQSNQKDEEVQYILKISAQKSSGDLLWSLVSFLEDGSFTFSLMAYEDSGFSTLVNNPVDLDVNIFFMGKVETQSGAPNLDLYPVRCYSSESNDPYDTGANFTLIINGCGSDDVSQDLDDTLSYTCADNSVNEAFSLRTYRYFGADEGAEVYIHCDFRVCLADVPDTKCECPDDPNTCVGDPVTDIAPVRRRRRSISDSVDESQLYHVVYGPFTFKQEELNKDEVAPKDQKETRQPSQTLPIVGAVCGVVAVAVICATVYLVIHYRSKRTQSGDLHVVT
nr:ZP domain-containing protein-like [Pocillopora verrucosa]